MINRVNVDKVWRSLSDASMDVIRLIAEVQDLRKQLEEANARISEWEKTAKGEDNE